MPRNITFTQEQKELVALLPNGLPKMTDGAKLVLSNIIYWYGTEFAKENGYIFRSDSDMRKDTGVSENTVKRAIRELEAKGFFDKVKRGVFGDRKNGTEFYLTEEMKEKIHFKPTESTQANNSISQANNSISQANNSISQANNSISQANNETEQLIEQMNTILMKLNELSEGNKQLREKIDRLEENFIGLTDTDTDTDTESLNNNKFKFNSTRDQEGPDKKENSLATNKEKEQVYRLGKDPEETRMLLDSKLRAVGSRIVDFEHVVVQTGDRYGKNGFFKFQSELSEELEKLPSSERSLRQDVMSYCHDLWGEKVNYTQPEPVPYKDFDFPSTLHEQVRPADFNDFEHLVRSSSKSLSGDRSPSDDDNDEHR